MQALRILIVGLILVPASTVSAEGTDLTPEQPRRHYFLRTRPGPGLDAYLHQDLFSGPR
jgi:hypothetical protein